MTGPAVRFHGKQEQERPFACSRELQQGTPHLGNELF